MSTNDRANPASQNAAHDPTTKSRDKDQDTIPRLQLIDEYQNFADELPEYIGKWGLTDAGLKYNVVAIVGSQSSGKNVEGSDGHERGDDKDFERKSALFSMATCEIVILNLWENQVGLHQGANLGMLRTVFEVNLQLFQSQEGKGKTLLMVIIRDFTGNTPMSNLKETLQTDFENIWTELSKPEGLENCKIQDYFDFTYTGLPHKLFVPEQFAEKVSELRYRFTDSHHQNYVFRSEYHKRIPADGYYSYASRIWDQIRKNKALDLPTQQELLAQHRCNELLNEALEHFNALAVGLKASILEKEQIVPDLGEQMQRLRSEAAAMFDRNASRYLGNVYQKMKEELFVQLNQELHGLFLAQLRQLRRKAVTKFNEDLKAKISKPSYNFQKALKGCLTAANEYFVGFAKAAIVSETDWSYNREHELLQQELEKQQQQREEEEEERVATQARLKGEKERREREEQERRATEERMKQEREQRYREHQQRLAMETQLREAENKRYQEQMQRAIVEERLQGERKLWEKEKKDYIAREELERKHREALDNTRKELEKKIEQLRSSKSDDSGCVIS
ncbi:Dynamin-like GTPase that mediates homotypic ER fusion [Apophysomyces ossiformis]|uniref:Dynamin-like GTPase that mediates homotypic ER fusion n=1 Tax=Apophysomyces ossiformis TaxID=679940 RepID=A0A8H7ESG4_9FUNG|nr:Dynamin-like GTPase that mediates homotypic ER fusion [Apophysomyces ossiformis]